MKRVWFYVALLICPGTGLQAQPPAGYNIEGRLGKESSSSKIFLRYFTPNGPVLDSAVITKGKFQLTGKVPGRITVARLYIARKGVVSPAFQDKADLWLEPGKIKIHSTGHLVNAKYSGTPAQSQFSELQDLLRPSRRKGFELDQAYIMAETGKDLVAKDKLLNEAYPALFAERQKILGSFIRKYPSSPVSAFMLEEFAGEGLIDLATVEPVYNLLSPALKGEPKVQRVAERIEIAKKTAPGMNAIEFSQTDTAGNSIALSSFRDKYVLIDFWAGWCMPCRAENPHLKKLYAEYNGKGFEILGVSLDGERKRWTQAIITDKLTWPQISDLNIFDNAVAKLYGITSIPQNILVGPGGKIIGWNFRGSTLENKLAELFKH